MHLQHTKYNNNITTLLLAFSLLEILYLFKLLKLFVLWNIFIYIQIHI